MVAKTNYLEEKFLEAVFSQVAFSLAADPFVALHTGDPGEAGNANEAANAGGSTYARQQAAFSGASGTRDNDADIEFDNMPSATITHVSIWDAVTAGNCLYKGALAASKVVNLGDTFVIAAGDLDISED